MLDLPRMQSIQLSGNPLGQKAVASLLLIPNYSVPPRVRIDMEGADRIPDEPVIFAMNHTDRYNYWPFMLRMWLDHSRFMAAWVKGKYYQNWWLGKFMEWTNNIPTVSRGYLIARDFKNVTGRSPSDDEYRLLRQLVDEVTTGNSDGRAGPEVRAGVPREVLERPRNLLGVSFEPSDQTWAQAVGTLFLKMTDRFVTLNGEAFQKGLDLLVFPQGTRSRRLSRGRIGIAQVALHFGRTIVPVGCNGSDEVYPGSSPWAKPGHITYRIGEPVTTEDMRPFQTDESFLPFTPEAERAYRKEFQGLVDLVMERINGLLEPRYQFSDDYDPDGVEGSARFI
jgi:1-acyl-sn-glycerol-3-phosphate acyltransferase